jgi:hypothetical protein
MVEGDERSSDGQRIHNNRDFRLCVTSRSPALQSVGRGWSEGRQEGAETMDAMTECTTWNQNHPVGTPVVARRDNGDELQTYTTNRAGIVGDRAVVWVKGISGCYMLDRVSALNEVPSEDQE